MQTQITGRHIFKTKIKPDGALPGAKLESDCGARFRITKDQKVVVEAQLSS
jgi:hypothetical protein